MFYVIFFAALVVLISADGPKAQETSDKAGRILTEFPWKKLSRSGADGSPKMICKLKTSAGGGLNFHIEMDMSTKNVNLANPQACVITVNAQQEFALTEDRKIIVQCHILGFRFKITDTSKDKDVDAGARIDLSGFVNKQRTPVVCKKSFQQFGNLRGDDAGVKQFCLRANKGNKRHVLILKYKADSLALGDHLTAGNSLAGLSIRLGTKCKPR